jgi:prepilin-type N-terminal cleavage/methylation domain-containing protein
MAERRGFTLIEMVVVIAVLAILAAIATPRIAMTAGMRTVGLAVR